MIGKCVFTLALLLAGQWLSLVWAGEPGLQGAWAAETYQLKTGPRHPVRGSIFFSRQDWLVLFFVLDQKGLPARASSEGGTYRTEGDRIEFSHRYHFSKGDALPGLPESPLRREINEAAAAPREAGRFTIEDDVLTLFFPSGNWMRFRRSSGSE